MISCNEAMEQISRLIDEDLSKEEQDALQEHLQSCESCRQLYSAFSGLSDAIAEGMEDVPEGFSDKVMSEIRRSAISPVKKNSSPAKKLSRYSLPIAALLALVIAIPVFTSNRTVKSEMAVAPMMAAGTTYAADSAPMEEAMEMPAAAEENGIALQSEEALSEPMFSAFSAMASEASASNSLPSLSIDKDVEALLFSSEEDQQSLEDLQLSSWEYEVTSEETGETYFVYTDGDSVWYNTDASDTVYKAPVSEEEFLSVMSQNG